MRSAALATGVSVGALDWTGDLILLVMVEGSRQDIESFRARVADLAVGAVSGR